MRWFGKTQKEPGWMAIALDDRGASYVHGVADGAGGAAIGRFGRTEAGSGAGEKLARDLQAERYQCVTLLQPGQYQMLVVDAPNVPQAELKSAIRWRIKDLLDFHVDDATVDVLDIPAEGGAAARPHSMYAVAARNEVIQAQVRAFEAAHIPLSVIDVPEVAQRNLSALHEAEGRGAALLYFNDEFGLLTITRGGELFLARRIDIGMRQMLEADADARGALFGRIVLELQRSFDHFDRQFHYVAVSKLVLGPEPRETGLLEHLGANLDLPVERADLAGKLAFDAADVPDAATQWRLFHLIGASLRREDKAL